MSIHLTADSDTGVSDSDAITRERDLNFDVTLDEDGVLDIDFDADGEADLSEWRSAGQYIIPAPQMDDGVHRIMATLSADAGDVFSEWVDVTVDTRSPELVFDLMSNALEFDGVNDYVATPLKINQLSSSPGITFEAWA